ncbi:MAG: alpha/beta fold hydrolase [Gemmatimonadota bacterium]|jgi:dipeptidyl aminopeptidase/acylaminoacyl peptidase
MVLIALAPVACGSEPGVDSSSPYGAPPGAPYTAEDVSFAHGDGRLAGTLTLPDGRGPFPAVVAVTGSGLQDRDEHIRGVGVDYRPFRDIADTLARRGIATLRFDDPGVGGSDPYPPDATPFDYADIVRSALAYLRRRSESDPDRLAVLGHSEGGVVAPAVAAADERVAALILLAGPAYTLQRVNRAQRRERMERTMPTASGEEIEAELDRTDRAAALEARGNPWRSAVWDYDPLPTARSISAPVLILQGEGDRRISPEQADTLAAAFRAGGNQDVTVRMFAATNHWFLAERAERSHGNRPVASHRLPGEVLGAIADWLVERLADRGGRGGPR